MTGTSLNRWRRQTAVALSLVLGLLLISCDKQALPTGPTPPPPPPLPTVQRSTGPIAFVSNREGSHAIYLADEDGSTVTRLIPTSVNSFPAWSPDRQRLAFVRQPEIYVVNVDGSGLRRIWSQGRTWGPVDWSPDGSKIAFMACCGTDKGIFVMNSDGSDVTRLVGHEFANPGCDDPGNACGVESPTWSPDGQQIAFVSSEGYGGFNNLLAISVRGAQRRFLLTGDGHSPAWSPDGTKIAFRRGDRSKEIGVVSADGSNRPLFLQVYGDDPRWAPDGSIIFSALNEAGGTRVFITTGTGSPRQLIPEATAPANPGYWDCCAVWAR
jgi:Tol biopolymer transport system component